MESLTEQVLAYADRVGVGAEPYPTPVAGLAVSRHFQPTELAPVLYQPIFCLVLQGAKQAQLGEEIITFNHYQSVIVGLNLPTFAHVTEAAPTTPYVALALRLDMSLVRELAAELDPELDQGEVRAIATAEADDAVVDAMGRLFGLLDKPAAVPVLRPLLLREIHFWLLSASHGALLRQLARSGSHVARIAEAMEHIRRHFAEPLVIPHLARDMGMSASAFHQHFKAISGTSPLQYQKRLRLLEGRRLMISEGQSVSAAAFMVGYESPTQFSREYARLFGVPPREHHRHHDTSQPLAGHAALP
jgi:AraC-like DNA-binding protein